MRLSDFYYDLPRELIAQKPLKERDKARLMVMERSSGTMIEKVFRDVVEYISEGDCLVLNDTRVIPARLYGRRKTGGRVEIFILDRTASGIEALVRPGKRLKKGETIELENGVVAVIGDHAGAGRYVTFDKDITEVLEGGHVPLPPYISRDDSLDDRNDYQTVYGASDGATASPTAGLHFTLDLLKRLSDKGVKIVKVTLHTSYGSFAPVKSDTIEEHRMHSESFSISEEAASVINKVKSSGGRVISVGTTSTRVLETAAAGKGSVKAMSGRTDLYIYPGYDFKVVDGIITNYHLPGSTLLILVCAFAGREFVLKAYRQAVESGFRFYSYGDAMLIL